MKFLVERCAGATRDLWVLNPKALPQFLEHESEVLAESEVKLATFHLSRLVRSVKPD